MVRQKLGNKEEFLARARQIYGNLYGYNNFVWNGPKSKGKITCFVHNEDFPQSPGHHIYRKQGCPKMLKRISSTNTNK